MIIAIAASQADFAQFQWYSNEGKDISLESGGKHLIANKDDLIGLRVSTSNNAKGTFQVVFAKYPQIIFRAIKPEVVAKFKKQLKEYKGVPDKPGKTGQRQRKITHDIEPAKDTDKMTAQFFRSPNKPRESGSYDKEDYQWRKIVHGGDVITTKHSGNTRHALKHDDVIGMRYLRKSHGGYIITPLGERVMIDHDLYEKITNNSDILPKSLQERGVVDLKDIKANLPKGTKIRMPRLLPPKPIKDSSDPGGEHGYEHFHGKHAKNLVSKFDYTEVDSEFDFEPEEEEALLNPPLEDSDFEDEIQETVNSGKKGTGVDDDFDAEFEDEDEDGDPETDFHHDIETDEETGEPIEDEGAVYAHEGLVLKTKDGEEWVVMHIEEAGLSDILVMYSERTKALRHYKVPTGEDMRNMKTVSVGGSISGKKLLKMQEDSAQLEMKAGKRL